MGIFALINYIHHSHHNIYNITNKHKIQALSLNPDDTFLHNLQGFLYLNQSEHDKAYKYRGIIYLKQKNLDNTLSDLNRAMALDVGKRPSY